MRVFVDTNVVIDVLVQRQPFYEDSARVWAAAELGACQGHVAAITFDNVFYILRKQIGAPRARELMRATRQVFSVVPVDAKVIDEALGSDISDFEDAIQYVCARRSRARYIVTRDPKHFPRGETKVVSPGEFLAALAGR
jgi:predicted nucleic acid-binding protein